jgi:carboxypeptidase family protein/TonB-dependent receptor-like protein
MADIGAGHVLENGHIGPTLGLVWSSKEICLDPTFGGFALKPQYPTILPDPNNSPEAYSMKIAQSRKMMLALAFVGLLAGTHSTTFAQNANSGEIKGTVTDSTNAVVPGASVTVLNIATGVIINTTTNHDGIFDLPSVEPGKYKITFSKPGFRNGIHDGITLPVGTIAVNETLQVGTAEQEVLVTADTPLVQTEDSGQHTDFDTKAVQDAPTIGGIWYNALTNELPGVNGGGGQDASGQGIGVNGTQGYSGSFLIEGSTATQPRDANASDNYPPIDAIGEVNVQTSNFGAQYGNGVATFNVLLKSGTNRFHGSAFEFIQNNAFNARNYFNPAPGVVAPIRWNQFGGSVGGPIIKDKLFFYFTFQTNPNTSSGNYTTTVPTQGQNGTTNMDIGCFPNPVNNPSTGHPYAGNCITSPLDPVALNIQKYFPAPNLPGYVNNYRVVQTNPSTSQWYIGKLDYVPAKSHRIGLSYVYFPISLVNSIDAFCSLGFDCTKGNNYNMDGQITDVWTISSTMLNEARIGGVREVDKYIPPTYGKGYPTTIGLQPTYGTNSPADIFPNITVSNGGGIGGIGLGGGVHAALADGSLAESDVFTLIKGKHTIKMGGEFNRSYQNYTSWGDVSSGSFTFNGVASGVPYADFLLGEVQTWNVYDYVETGARSKSAGAFVQDNYKVSQHLSLNVGLRYQFQGGWGESENRWGTFNPTVVNTGQFAPKGALGAMSYGGQEGRNLIQNSANEWAPRIGMSYSPLPTWAFRASYGITDVPWATDPYSGAYGVGLNPQGFEGGGSSAVFLLKNGPPPGSVVYPTLSNLSNSQFNYDNVSYYPQKRPITYYQETLFSVQHEIPGQVLLDVSYVFTKGTHLGFSRDINAVPLSAMNSGTNCFSGVNAFPLFCSIDGLLFDGYSNYNALQFRAEKRLSHGLSFIFNYAWAKSMDSGTGSGNNAGVNVWQNAFNVSANYGLSTLDVRNTINGSATYELPFGSGKMVGLHGFADQALGGWRLTGIFQVHSGIPFTPTVSSNGQDLSGSGVANTCFCGYSWLPNVVGNPHVTNPSPAEFFNPAAFVTPASGTFGNERRDSLIGPNWRDLDLSLGKTFRLIEGIRLEIRADSFNSFNHPNFAQPSGATGTGVTGGGQITSANGARSIQLGGRFTF